MSDNKLNDTEYIIFICQNCNKGMEYCECPACCVDCGQEDEDENDKEMKRCITCNCIEPLYKFADTINGEYVITDECKGCVDCGKIHPFEECRPSVEEDNCNECEFRKQAGLVWNNMNLCEPCYAQYDYERLKLADDNLFCKDCEGKMDGLCRKSNDCYCDYCYECGEKLTDKDDKEMDGQMVCNDCYIEE